MQTLRDATGMKTITHSYSGIHIDEVNVSIGVDAVAHGKHVSIIWACTRCHGDDLNRRVITNDHEKSIVASLCSVSN